VEVIGFSARASAANKTNKLMPYVIQSAYILLPPTLFAATIYMCLGRIIRLVEADHLSIIRPQSITKIFVGGDVVSFIILGASSGLSVMARTNPLYGKIGNWCVIAGLVIQLLSFCFFVLTAALFHSRLRRFPTERSFQINQSWIQTLYMLYGVSGLILVRSVFRIIEYTMGNDGYLLKHEWTLYVFDAVPMSVVAGLFYWRYPDYMVPKVITDIELESQHSEAGMMPDRL
jgi:hypothetical protein